MRLQLFKEVHAVVIAVVIAVDAEAAAAAAAKTAIATLIAFCSTYSIICLIYFSFSLHFLYINYLDFKILLVHVSLN